MKDYSNYPIDKDVYFGGAERKIQITINNRKYIVKFQKNSEIGKVFNHVSEYLGSHIFDLLGIPVQETFLGLYNDEEVVILKHFCLNDEKLVPFNGIGESSLEENKEMYQYSYEDIMKMLMVNKKSTNVPETVERFWDMFIVDALIGNFDRHGGNWGFIKLNNNYRIAPVYDNGSCLYPRVNTDSIINEILSSEEELSKRIYKFPTSHIKLDGFKSSYYEVINSLKYEECNNALIRIFPRIDFTKIDKLIEEIECINDVRKKFYKIMLRARFEKILKPAYEKIVK